MFNLLIDDLPVSVIVGGTEYKIRYDAKTMIQLSTLLELNPVSPDDEVGYEKIAMEQLKLFYPIIPENKYEAMQRLIEFYTHSQANYDQKPNNGNAHESNEKRSYSFHYDSHLIYSAFLQQYPTKKVADLHWFEFKAMLEGLTDDCLFVKVTQWRSVKITTGMPKADKQFYRRMKRLYALPDNRAQEQKDNDFASMLFNL